MNIFIMALEPLETRYTGQWFTAIPQLLEKTASDRDIDVEVHNIAGDQVSSVVTEGAFLDFFATNIWKNTQVNRLVEKFRDGTVKAGDKILFTDAWHTGVIQVRYMSELMNIPVEIHSMWHAGSYDPQDFLGRLIHDKRWTYNTERGLFHASHFNYFATYYHRDLFIDVLFGKSRWQDREEVRERCVISGQPHNALVDTLQGFVGMPKRDLVLFPHRLAPEKQPEIFRDLSVQMPDVEFVVCQDSKLSKQEYHELLGSAKIIFSANLQETLGISAMEGVLVDALPLLPDRLSYSEMYLEEFLYPSKWTESWNSYLEHRDEIIGLIRKMLKNSNHYQMLISEQREVLLEKYLSCEPMVNRLLADSSFC